MIHLTQYSANSTYAQWQLAELAQKMNINLKIDKDIQTGYSINLSNEIASFIFKCISLDESEGGCANYYRLVKISKHLPAAVGARVISEFQYHKNVKQGDIGTVVGLDDKGQWQAKFENGIYSIGDGHFFFVISKASFVSKAKGKISFFKSDTEKLYVNVHRAGKRRKYVDETGQVFVKVFGHLRQYPQEVSY